jgi:uncharacterized membrane protein
MKTVTLLFFQHQYLFSLFITLNTQKQEKLMAVFFAFLTIFFGYI